MRNCLFAYQIKHQAMKTYWELNVQTYLFLASALVGVDWRPVHINPGEISLRYLLDKSGSVVVEALC
jgi:hypothetical protein